MDFFNGNEVSISFDEDTKIIRVPEVFKNNSKGMGHAFFLSMRRNCEKVAQYISDTDEKDTYGCLLQRCVRAALHLQTRNLEKDDVICLCSHNHLNSCVPFVASVFLGLKVASLDPSFNVADATHLIKLVKPKMFFISHDSVELIEEAAREAEVTAEIVVFGKNCDHGHTEFNDFLQESHEEDSFVPVEIDNLFETIVILFSSGTTGLPKGICLNHYGTMGQAVSMMYLGGLKTVNLSYASLYWISAIMSLIAAILNGSARVMCSKFDAAESWRVIDKYKVSNIFYAPFQASQMIKAGRPEGLDTTSLLTLMTGGGHFAVKQMEALRDLFPGSFLFQAYGQTEVSGFLTSYNVYKVKDRLCLYEKPASCGRPVPGISYKVVELETERACGPNERGELRVKTNYSMNGYYNMDSTDSFDSEGWLRTGDIVYYDEDQCFFVVDRIKELLKYKSWHVAPAVLEQVLHSHPAVKRAVVIGIPHEEDGDHPMALVLLEPNYEKDTSPNEIENFVSERVHDRQKLRAGVKFVDEFLVTPSGKVRRNEMRQIVLKELYLEKINDN